VKKRKLLSFVSTCPISTYYLTPHSFKMNRVNFPINIILLALLGINSVFGCRMCHNGDSIPDEFNGVVLDADGSTCQHYQTAALALDETDEKCESYYQLLGKARCGCLRPEDAPGSDERCHVCKNGAPPPENNFIDMTRLGLWDAGSITCHDAKDYLLNFSVSTNACDTFQTIGLQDCGCTNLLPTSSPSPTTSPSRRPSYSFADPDDCDALNEGIFPMVDSDYLGSTDVAYTMSLKFADGYTFVSVASDLQDKMDIIVSLAANEACSGSRRRMDVRRVLSDVFIHYVDFERLQDVGGGVAEGNAEVFYSSVPGSTRKRNLVDADSLSGLITGIINEKASEIANEVEGVEGIEAGEEVGNPDSQSGDMTGVAIGVGVGCAAVVLIAGLLASRKKGIKKELSSDVDRLEFLPSARTRSDGDGLKKGQVVVPSGKARSGQTGVEFYPEDYSLQSDDDSLSTNQRDLVFVAANAAELEAAPKYGINDAFPIQNSTNNRDPFQDSDSSDDDFPMDEEKERRPIAVRKKPSYRVKNTMEL